MLRKFEVKNFKNFQDWFVFDLSDIKSYEFNAECIEGGISAKGIIYGANGCGKTNFGRAIFDIKTHLTDDKIDSCYVTNYLNANLGSGIAEFRYTFQFGEDLVEYAYGKKAVNKLVYETVSINQQQVISFDRRADKEAVIELAGAETLNKAIGDSDISIVKYVQNNTVLDEDSNNKAMSSLYGFVDAMSFARTINSHNEVAVNSQAISEFILVDGDGLSSFEKFLNDADVNCKLTTIEVDGGQRLAFDFSGRPVEFCRIASTGTLSLTLLFMRLWTLRLRSELCEKGAGAVPFIFIDEFDAFYHQAVSKMLVMILKRDRCQAILTTHNTSIMTNDLLRPDCYFFMNETTIKPMHRLTEKELRKAHNIEKMYKAGAFNG